MPVELTSRINGEIGPFLILAPAVIFHMSRSKFAPLLGL